MFSLVFSGWQWFEKKWPLQGMQSNGWNYSLELGKMPLLSISSNFYANLCFTLLQSNENDSNENDTYLYIKDHFFSDDSLFQSRINKITLHFINNNINEWFLGLKAKKNQAKISEKLKVDLFCLICLQKDLLSEKKYLY